MNKIFDSNWKFSEKYMPQIKQILVKHGWRFIKIEIATAQEDMTQAFDLNIVACDKSRISVRIRRANTRFRDFTVRSLNNGSKTEIHKLREGFGDWYLYAWEGDDNKIIEYALIDIHKARDLFKEDRKAKLNTDGKTGFYSYTFEELAICGALIAYEKK